MLRRGRRFERRAVAGPLDEADRQLGLPRQSPRLAERARRSSSLLHRAPRHSEGEQPVEQDRASHARSGVRRSHSIVVGSAVGRRRADFCRRVTSRASGTCGADDGTVPIASPTTSSRRTSADVAHHGVGGVEHLGSARAEDARAARRVSSASRVPAIRSSGDAPSPARRNRPAISTKNASDARRTGVGEHVAVPAGARHAGRVARRRAQPAMRPRHPRRGDLHLGEPAQDRRVAAGGAVHRRGRRARGRARRRRRRRSGRSNP